MGRGLILEREPLRRPLLRQSPKTPARHAALAILSDCCSPLQGRLSTCYAPVRRFTQGLPPFLARLACVKPAANVRSEPGSNSPIEMFSPDRTLFQDFSQGLVLFLVLPLPTPSIQFSEPFRALYRQQETPSNAPVRRFFVRARAAVRSCSR